MNFVNQVDFSILNFIVAHFQCGALDMMMPMVSALGNNGFIWGILALVLLWKKEHRKTGWGILAVLVIGFIICNLGIKPMVARIRPFEFNSAIKLLVTAPLDYSFPSGHTWASFAAVTVLFLHRLKGRYMALAFAMLMAFSRLYLYVHYPTDVLAGILIGIGLGVMTVYLGNKIMAGAKSDLCGLGKMTKTMPAEKKAAVHSKG